MFKSHYTLLHWFHHVSGCSRSVVADPPSGDARGPRETLGYAGRAR
jgi:hypothetical protein